MTSCKSDLISCSLLCSEFSYFKLLYILIFCCFSCLIHGKAFYFGVLLPCALVLAGNFVVLLVALVRIANSASFVGCSTAKRQSVHETLNSIKIALAFGTLLGITWVFAMLAIGANFKLALQKSFFGQLLFSLR